MKTLRIFIELIKKALRALIENRLRPLLSLVGIAIGIAAVMRVSAVSSGGKAFVMEELETFGLRSIWVFRDFNDKDPKRRVREGSGLQERDLIQLHNDCCPALRRVSPVVLIGETVAKDLFPQMDNPLGQYLCIVGRKYRVNSQVILASYLKTVERILAGITAMGVVAASVSLLVGGIGVAGIMSTAVVERIREIGVGLASGYFPAQRAAGFMPVEALRRE